MRMSNVFVWRGHAIVFNSLVVTVSLGVCLDLKKYVQIIAIIIKIIPHICHGSHGYTGVNFF